MGLHFAAEFGNQPLRLHREQLCQPERSDTLYGRGGDNHKDDGDKKVKLTLADDVVDQILGGVRQDQPGAPVNGHQNKAQGQETTARPYKLPDMRDQFAERRRVPCIVRFFRAAPCGTHSLSSLADSWLRWRPRLFGSMDLESASLWHT